MPFRWTINPYRGCGHACVYCLSGDTPILMVDGRTKPLVNIEVGDQIYGTRRVGAFRRYEPTTVLAHWSTIKPAYRITLQDGTELVAGGDHRFLSDQGWKYVTGSQHGESRRPHLTTGIKLVGSGRFAEPPVVTEEYRAGHLCGMALKSSARLGVVGVEPTGLDLQLYDITTGTGDFIANGVVSHNCFARRTHEHLELDSGRDFDTKIMVKVNAGELLRKELANPRWCREPVAMGTNTDPYQRAEGRYQLMPEIICAFRDFANPFSILTKGRLILRDAGLIAEAAEVTDVGLAVSVGFVGDDDLWRSVEPGTPRPSARLDVVRRFADLGLGCAVLMAPILPGLTDSEERIDRTVAAIAAAGARGVTPIVLHLRPGAREWYAAWLAREHPHLLALYRELYGNGSYAPKRYREVVGARVRQAARRHGLWRTGGGAERGTKSAAAVDEPGAPDAGEQLSLL